MAKVRRIYEIAKELNVASKAIVDKCLAEEIPDIKDHMSPVKKGLEMTIREWFSDHAKAVAEPHTAVESAAPVDLEKAKKARRKRAKAVGQPDHGDHGDHGDDAHEHETATAVEELPTKKDEPVTVEVAAMQVAMPAKAKPKKHEESAPAETMPTVVEEVPSTKVLPAAAEVSSTAVPAAKHAVPPPVKPVVAPPLPKPGPAGRPNVPTRPNVVSPAGPQLQKPSEVTLKGPKVVRVEQPDVIQRPRPKRPPGTGGRRTDGDESALADGTVEGISRSRGPTRGKGAGSGATPETPETIAEKTKRRTLSNRRGRSSDVTPTGSKRLSEADYQEQQDRLNRSRGIIARHRQDARKPGRAEFLQSPAEVGGKVAIREPITIKGLSAATGIKAPDIIKWLFAKGVMATINSAIATEAAMEVALEYDIELDVQEQESAEQIVVKEFATREATDLRPRPTVVTVLGHVDHGKTSLLDAIRQADVAAHEAGGITQHIGAYRVQIKGHDQADRSVVFLDTPGHEAFTSMRARGAKITDVVVLVVAADDGVMPQTIESINHAKAAGVPIIVALNKIDKAEATVDNIRKIFGQLAEHGLSPVEWGGSTEVVKVSATKKTGVAELLELLDYQAQLLELKADYAGAARGTVIESQMVSGRGSVARLLVQDGQLKIGDFIVMGRSYGRLRDMKDDKGRELQQAGPATPVEISGIEMLPDAGDKFYVVDSLQKAEEIAEQFRMKEREKQLVSVSKVTLENLADKLKEGATKELRVVLKADVQGSIDVLRKSLEELGNNEVSVKVIHAAVGSVTESDVLLADASEAVIIGFHVSLPAAVREIADERHVEARLYRIIYECTDDIKKSLEGMLVPERKEELLGEAEVREVFKISKLGSVAGCIVTSGAIQRIGKMRIERDGVVVTDERQIESLRRVKEDAKEVRAGTECGIRLAGFDDIKPGDRLVCYRTVEIKRKLA